MARRNSHTPISGILIMESKSSHSAKLTSVFRYVRDRSINCNVGNQNSGIPKNPCTFTLPSSWFADADSTEQVDTKLFIDNSEVARTEPDSFTITAKVLYEEPLSAGMFGIFAQSPR